MSRLAEIDSLEVVVIVDNEVDPMSPCMHPSVQASGGMRDISMKSTIHPENRGGANFELRMDNICCGAHGLSLMITAVQGEKRRTVLFDTGPEEDTWERNVRRLRPNLASIKLIQLSHWHRDHSGGMLRAIRMIHTAKGPSEDRVIVDVHPNRPDYRGIMATGPVSLEADPSFEEIKATGAILSRPNEPHTVLDDMFLISGEIPRVTPYETGFKRGIRFDSSKGTWKKDELILDERFLMCNLKGKGVVVFTGCSHAGAINASKHAMQFSEGSPLYCVVGGYHLADAEVSQIQETVRDFRKLGPKILIPGHCSGWRVKYEIEKKMPGCLVPSFVGSKFIL
ncbi:hypothetical protein AOQ84DRAFT_282485 [Glonium stellatum]|uniref:Metallo-beta-lactamase domain-containing protein n=1 Tax=Glonium stellatum TaxID=574774 RepID=A0A8E2FB45_9PEZI|nr:hypothetical protein AOQ84DRAFT_282485 [Glonium stellatum]